MSVANEYARQPRLFSGQHFFGGPTENILTDVSSFSVVSAAGIVQGTHIRGLSELASDTTGVTGLAGRYASALFELAEEQNALDQIADDVRTLAALIDGNNELTRMVRSPVISRSAQGAAMDTILTRAGASELTRKFVGLTAANRRLFALMDIINGYLMILAGRRGELTADITSAQPLNDKQTHDLLNVLKRSVGGNVRLNTKVDPNLLGGLIIKVGSRMVDSSLNTKLQQLRLAMRGVG